MKEYIFFDASGTEKKKKRDDCTFGSGISRGEENVWATLCSSGADALNCLPVITLLKWISHSIHYPLGEEIAVACVGIYFLSGCNLEDCDSVHEVRKTQGKVLSSREIICKCPSVYGDESCFPL